MAQETRSIRHQKVNYTYLFYPDKDDYDNDEPNYYPNLQEEQHPDWKNDFMNQAMKCNR